MELLNKWIRKFTATKEPQYLIPQNDCSSKTLLCGPTYGDITFFGSFLLDAIAVKRNAIPLFGKIIQPALQKKIIEKRVRDIYICLDADALRNALQIAERFMAEGINVHFVELQSEDASELGFQQIREILNDTDVLTFERVMELKMGMLWK